MEEPGNRENTGIQRNPDGTFPPGVSGNPSGRPKGTMKDYLRRKFMEMSDEEKEEFLEKVPAEMQIKLAEGNPAQDVTSAGERIIPIPILSNVPTDNSNQQDTEPEQAS